MSLTLAKLGYLFIKTIAKPISSLIKRKAVRYASFRNACVDLAQKYHRLEVHVQRKLKERGKSAQLPDVKPLSEEKAVEIGGTDAVSNLTVGSEFYWGGMCLWHRWACDCPRNCSSSWSGKG